MIKNSREKFGSVAIGLHWLVAVLTLTLLGVGLYMSDMEASATKLTLYGLHKSFGATVLFLMVLRLAWRLASVQPDFVTTMKPLEKTAAKLAYFGFYVLLFVMPMSGWLMSSAAGRPVNVFGLFTLPDLIAPDKDLRELFGEGHELAAWALMGLIALHVMAALKHHFIIKDDTLRKMLPLLALGFLIPAMPAQAVAAAPDWEVLAAESHISFSGKQMGSTFEGQFKTFAATIAFDPAHLDQSKVTVSIDVASATTQDAERDRNLGESDWFNTGAFPKATYTSRTFRKLEDGRYEAEGDLTIRDKTLPITFLFTLAIAQTPDDKERAVMDASLVLKRLDFNLGLGEWKDPTVIENDVPVSLHIVAERALAH